MNDHAGSGSAPDTHTIDHHLSHSKKVITTLAIATAVEFGLSGLMAAHHLGFVAGVVLLVVIAFFKAALVAKFFMHLSYDARLLALLCMTPLILASPLLAICCFDMIAGPAM